MWLLSSVVIFISLICPVIGEVERCYPHNCIAGQAECRNNNCVCNNPPYSWGRGNFACYTSNQVAAEVKNDPLLTTFNNDSVKFHHPCRYLLTSVKVEMKEDYGVRVGFCYFNVHAFHKRVRGKIVVDGIEIAAKFELGYHNIKSMSVITYGQCGNVTLGGTDDDFLECGPYGHDLTNGPVIYSDPGHNFLVKRYYNSDNRQYVFEVENCGFKATFTPYEVGPINSAPFVPGISVAVDCDNNPQWLQNDKVMALSPERAHGVTIESIAHHLGLTQQQAMVYRAFTRHVSQSFPGACPVCSDVSTALKKCDADHLVQAFDKCYWILDRPRFIRCISPDYPDTTSQAHLDFFITCVEHYCDGRQQCHELRKKTSCHSPELAHIISSTCYGY